MYIAPFLITVTRVHIILTQSVRIAPYRNTQNTSTICSVFNMGSHKMLTEYVLVRFRNNTLNIQSLYVYCSVLKIGTHKIPADNMCCSVLNMAQNSSTICIAPFSI